jgi:hypothetical protein
VFQLGHDDVSGAHLFERQLRLAMEGAAQLHHVWIEVVGL